VNLVNLETAVKAHGDRALLDRVSIGVAAGDRIGVVGRNGAGKTTLLAALAGTTGLDSGRATRAGGTRIGYLPQQEVVTGRVRDAVFGSLPEHEWAAQPRSRAVITALLSGLDLDQDAKRISGGERRRVALAALLRTTHDLLLLDEPTNHLDLETVAWLAGYLREHARSYRTWELADGRVHAYDGGYSAYVLARAERARLAEASDQRRRNLLRKELAWLRRGPPARTSKPKFRIAAAAALVDGEPPPRDSVELTRLATARLGKTVLELDQVTVTAGPRTLLDQVTWQLGPGERAGVVGVNGSGKTTLLRLLAGTLSAPGAGLNVSGRVVRGQTVRAGYLTQEPQRVDPGLRVLEAAEQVRATIGVGTGELSASQLLDRLGLGGERQWAPVGELSGGERRRLQLLLVLLGEPNVLLLDEPGNDLDIDTLNELEDLLDGWPGSAVVVSHDRYFLERVTDHVLGLIDGQLAYLPGGVDEYLELRGRQRAGGPATGQPAGAGAARRADAAGTGPASGRPVTAARQRAGQKELARLDRQLARLAAEEDQLTEALARSAADYAALIELGGQLRALAERKDGLEERWLELAEELGR
jgi:ATP-binding cassette subfamily F protein uup